MPASPTEDENWEQLRLEQDLAAMPEDIDHTLPQAQIALDMLRADVAALRRAVEDIAFVMHHLLRLALASQAREHESGA